MSRSLFRQCQLQRRRLPGTPGSIYIVFALGRQRRQSRRPLIVRDGLFLVSTCTDTSIGKVNGYIELQSISRGRIQDAV